MSHYNQLQYVSSFDELTNTAFQDPINAICWNRKLMGNFSEIVQKITFSDNIKEVTTKELLKLDLSQDGQIACKIILKDLNDLKTHGASPVLNIIKSYERDDALPFFPTDVYSYHVDRSPVPTATFLCTYSGASSEILPNDQGQQKVLVPEIRVELLKLFGGPEGEDFEDFLAEYFFDLHYQEKPNAKPISLGIGNLWKLAVDHPQSKVLPCLHRAPSEKSGENRLLLIC